MNQSQQALKQARQTLLVQGLKHKHHQKIARLRSYKTPIGKAQAKSGRALRKHKQLKHFRKYFHSYSPDLFYCNANVLQ